MYLVLNESHDPAFNLALEEYALTRMNRDVIILWRNAKAVIIGNNQNAVEEIDLDYVREHDIAVIRRQSGGGAVFHDLGNVNYTVIHALGEGDFSNYEKFTTPICRHLQSLGVDARLQGRNDLVIDGMKFSGNAQAVKNNRIMHHGCILFNADVSDLAKALKPKAEKIESKGIKSVRSRVTNIHAHLARPMAVEAYFESLADYFRDSVEGMEEYVLTGEDIRSVEALAGEKYRTWDWNFGKSPHYNFGNSKRYPFGIVDVRLDVDGGVIRNMQIYGDFFGMLDKEALEALHRGVRHQREAVAEHLQPVDLESYIHGMTLPLWLDLLC